MSERASGSSAQRASLSGRELAADLRRRTTESAAALTAAGRPPRLAIVVATADESSAWYVRSIAKAAAAAGIVCDIASPAPAEIHGVLSRLGEDDAVHGIILQTPLPAGVDIGDLAPAIPPAKDVDGANPASLGRLAAGLPAFAPATAEAVLALLDHHGVALAGRHAVVVGRSTVVGKPAAHLLLDRDATVTICHSRTSDLAAITRQADVLVAAVGRPGLITPEHVSPGTVVIDVGTNPTADGGLVGDVDPAVAQKAAGLTPVPGGVGPVTTALLLQHTVRAAGGP
jgi:methylenetetrahydrofolate dehydrogenase (NADP+)/methenyltetrahydrofolate cyclohydrolase